MLLLLSHFSRVRLYVTPWTAAHQVSLSMGFSRQEYWSGLQCSPPGDLPNPGIEPGSPALQADPLPLSHQGSPRSKCDSSNVKHTNLTSWNSMCFLLQNPRPARVGNRNAYTSLDSVLPAHLQWWRLCRASWLKDNSFKHIFSRILLKTLHYVLTKNQGAPRPWSCLP